MQTLNEIRRLLAAAGISPLHRFGQNFLIDLNLMRKLVAAAALQPGDVVLEVGPGTGSLTEALLDRDVRVIAVEIDRGLQAVLRDRLGQRTGFTLIAGDILAGKHAIAPDVLDTLDAQRPHSGGAYKLVANLPYNISTPLLIELLCGGVPFERLACTIQKELADRFAATAGSAAYGTVSVVAQSLAQVETVARVPASAFWPRPQVESAMLLLRPLPSDQTGVADALAFAGFVRRAFGQRRKMLRASARNWCEGNLEALLERAEVSPDARPQELPPTAWRRLFAARPAGHE